MARKCFIPVGVFSVELLARQGSILVKIALFVRMM